MVQKSQKIRTFRVFRYDPTAGEDGHFDRFDLKIENESTTTILDALFKIQRLFDPSLSFRYSCRVGMCGSCAVVINGLESLACKTVIADLKEKEISVRPLNHFPVVKDLIVDMNPFFDKYDKILPYFQASEENTEPAVIRPDSKERKVIGLSTECIACGCCVSSCSMAHWHKDYLGPGALNRAFTLLADSRDGFHQQRMARVLAEQGCYNCRLELNCTEVCPKEISPTRAIKYMQRLALKEAFRPKSRVSRSKEEAFQPKEDRAELDEAWTRRRFLSRTTIGLAAASALVLGGLVTATAIFPTMQGRPRKWVRVGRIDDFPPDSITTVNIRYRVNDGFYKTLVNKPVMISRLGPDKITVFNSRCPHLGCTVRWDEGKDLFLCACHGGAFYPDGRVKAGPPPRPLERYLTSVRDGELYLQEA